jgi:nucleotide-binding universal stress UspA family protein
MEKIMLALDSHKLSKKAIDFACYISRLTHSKLTGIFLENQLYEYESELQTMRRTSNLDSMPTIDSDASPQKRGLTEENIRLFKEACCLREVSPLIHRDRGVPASEIIEESRFADCIIIDPETSFILSYKASPGRFVKDILSESECPIIISPNNFDRIDEIIFSYNGSKSSVFAIKNFSYLFPELGQKKTTVLSVINMDDSAIEEHFKLKEWLKNHYQEVEFVILKGDPSDQLLGYLLEKKNSIVVMGAFGRGTLSRFIKPSHARLIIKSINLPIFISHG